MSLTSADAALLEQCLAGDGVAVIPTDTVYGLACNPNSQTAVRRVYELKQRPPVKPAAVMFFAVEPALQAFPELGTRTRAAVHTLLPGPVTLLLPNPKRRFPLACNPEGARTDDSNDTRRVPVGLRVPLLADPLTTLATVTVAALQSSANFSGRADPRRLLDVPAELRAAADLVLDGGELPGIASTVVDLCEYEQSGRWRVVREGPIERTALERLLG